ncbi:MAG TPA: hypothetical protein V6D09_02925 [Leptolyngbyaceae cyanobacterium]
MNLKRISAYLLSVSLVSSSVVFGVSKTEAQTTTNLKKCMNSLMYETRDGYVPYGESARKRTEINSKTAALLCRNSNKSTAELKKCIKEMMYETRDGYVPYGESARKRTEISAEAAAEACV